MGKNYDVITCFHKMFSLRKPEVVVFADMIIIFTNFIKTILNDSRKFRRTINYVSEWNPYLYFLM